MAFNLSVTAQELNNAVAKANAAAPQSTTYTKAETDTLLAKKPGEITTGKQYTIDGQTVTASTGAEAFNDLANNKAAGQNSHAEGASTTASGTVSHAEGNSTTASGSSGHAEGTSTTASGTVSHAEGAGTTASGMFSHAEGFRTTASGNSSHAEGSSTTASGTVSHAEGEGTKASSAKQHVQGKFNVEDTNDTYAFIIGNGTADNARHNAFAIDWNGLIYVNGSATGVDVSQLTPVTVDQTYSAQSANAQSGTAVAEAIGSIPAEVKRIFSQDFALTWGTTESQLFEWFASNIEIEAGKLYLAIITTSGDKSVFLSAILPCNTVGTSVTAGSDFIPIVVGSKSGCTVGKATIILYKGSGVRLIMDLPPAPSGYSINNQSSTLEIYEIQRLLMNDSISADDYASQTIGGTVKAWTTTDGSDTILHLATQ